MVHPLRQDPRSRAGLEIRSHCHLSANPEATCAMEVRFDLEDAAQFTQGCKIGLASERRRHAGEVRDGSDLWT